MENEYLIRAYLDDYDLITVEIDNIFCGGISERFDVVVADRLIKTEIVSSGIVQDKTVYTLKPLKQLQIGQPYFVMAVNGYRTPLIYRYIVKTDRFNNEFYYEGNDLGSIVLPQYTSFKVWAPTASLVSLCVNEKTYSMKRGEKGVWQLFVKGDLTGYQYSYLCDVNGNTYRCSDPYGKASTANSEYSVVCQIGQFEKVELQKFDNREIVVYEDNIADNGGTFVDYLNVVPQLKQLGITHLQLLPVSDYATVDEYHKDIYYNWGYDPLQYQVLEGSYSSDVYNPLKIREDFAQLVKELHRNGIRINLDMVFNHHYYAHRSSFSHLVPYYWFRYENGQPAAGTFCGSECDSQQLMFRKYIIDTLKYFVEEYDVDGFRFDLMNFIDIETMNQAYSALKEIKEDIMMYGEGWDMRAAVDSTLLATYKNAEKLNPIGFFNDQFRDIIKGSTFSNNEKGYGTGRVDLAPLVIKQLESKRYGNPYQSVNYVECHDDMTLYDKISICCNCEDEVTRVHRQKFINGLVILSQGIAFIHGGQQFCGSKQKHTDAYNKREFNLLTEERRQQYIDVVKHTADLIEIRKMILPDQQVEMKVISEELGIIEYKKNDFTVVINPSLSNYGYLYENNGTVIFDGYNACQFECSKLQQIGPLSIVVIRERND